MFHFFRRRYVLEIYPKNLKTSGFMKPLGVKPLDVKPLVSYETTRRETIYLENEASPGKNKTCSEISYPFPTTYQK